MNKLKTLFKQHFWLIALIGLAIIAIGIFILGGYLEEKSFDKTVSKQTNQANAAVRESKIESGVAANLSIERRGEDAVRERVILPELKEVRRRSKISQKQYETAQKQYEKSQTEIENLDRSIADNCAQLKRLYPNTKFEYCFER